jgi:GntR family transcriptional regulator
VLVMSLQRPALRVSSPVPLYEQIVRHVTDSVARGDIQPGDRLPAVRDLADQWEVGVNTLVRAWDILQERGVLEVGQGKGTFVAVPGDATGQ